MSSAPNEDIAVGRWIPLESNPEVMNSWASKLGLSKVNSFEDVYGLDEDLLSLVPQPSKALLLVFPLTDAIELARRVEDQKIAEDGQHKLDPRIVFIKQTIPNACGTIGLLHALANSDVTIDPATPLAHFFEETAPLNPLARGKLLEETSLFAEAHVAAASRGQSVVPSAKDEVDLHFIAFVHGLSEENPGERRLVELDGRRQVPLDHGKSEDLLKDVAKVLRHKYISLSGSQNFGLISLGPTS